MFQSKILKIFLTIAISSNLCFGQDAQYLPKGSTTEMSGFLFSVPRTQELRKTELEHHTYKLLNESLEKSLSEQNLIITQEREKEKILLDRNDVLARDLKDARDTSDKVKILWFALGVVGTGLAIYGASKIPSR